MNDTQAIYNTLDHIISTYELSGEQVLQLFTNFHGLQILSDDFLNFVNTELDLDY